MSSEVPIELSPGILTPDYAGKLGYYSFRYSQGDRGGQRIIYRYLHKLQPLWQIPEDDFFDESVEVAVKQVNNLFKPLFARSKKGKNQPTYHAEKGKHSSVKFKPKDIKDTVKSEMEVMQLVFNNTEPNEEWGWLIRSEWEAKMHERSMDFLVELLTQAITVRDYYFIVEENGRDYKNTNPNNPAGDPWSSHIIDYALKGHNTGLPEYDQMFRDIRDYILGDHGGVKRARWMMDTYPRLQEIAQVYNGKHPNSPCPTDFGRPTTISF